MLICAGDMTEGVYLSQICAVSLGNTSSTTPKLSHRRIATREFVFYRTLWNAQNCASSEPAIRGTIK